MSSGEVRIDFPLALLESLSNLFAEVPLLGACPITFPLTNDRAVGNGHAAYVKTFAAVNEGEAVAPTSSRGQNHPLSIRLVASVLLHLCAISRTGTTNIEAFATVYSLEKVRIATAVEQFKALIIAVITIPL